MRLQVKALELYEQEQERNERAQSRDTWGKLAGQALTTVGQVAIAAYTGASTVINPSPASSDSAPVDKPAGNRSTTKRLDY